jgi:hypothetical protein
MVDVADDLALSDRRILADAVNAVHFSFPLRTETVDAGSVAFLNAVSSDCRL